MSINIQLLKDSLVVNIAALTGGATAEELLLLSTSVANLTEDRIVSVATPDDLPILQTSLTELPFPSGSVFFVESLKVLVISSNARWVGFDGRVLRSDVPDVINYAWGLGTVGRLGDGTTTTKSSPVTVVGGITNWSQLSANKEHNLGLTSTGIAYAWGRGTYGRLGDGTTISRLSPVTVVGGITNWSQLSAGYRHSLGVTSTGIAYAWGLGISGQLGGGNTDQKFSPVTVAGGITNWSQLSAGYEHSLGVTSAGIAYAWGAGAYGRLGDGTTVNKSSPVTVVGGITNWAQVSAGHRHSLGLTSSGVAYAWGNGGRGQLGDDTTINKSSPVTVVGGITNWSQLSASAGGEHSLGLTSTGIAYAWGRSTFGQLGDGATNDRSSPVTVVGGITNWSQLSAGYRHSLGVTSTGIAYAWGNGTFGQLGDGATNDRSSPVTVAGGITNWGQVSAGSAHSLAFTVT